MIESQHRLFQMHSYFKGGAVARRQIPHFFRHFGPACRHFQHPSPPKRFPSSPLFWKLPRKNVQNRYGMSKFSTTLRNMRPNQKTAVFVALALLINAGTAVAVDLSKFPKDPSFTARIMGEALAGGNMALGKKMLERIPEELRTQLDWSFILGQAVLLGHPDSAEWILKTGKPKLVTTADKLPLLLGAILPTRIEKTDAIREELVAMLLAAGAKPDAIHPTKKTTALEAAGARHDRALISLLESTAPEK